LKPGGLYCLRFVGRVDPDAQGGCVVAGTSGVNRDFRLTENWREYSYIFSVPLGAASDFVRLGQWEQKGAAYFDQVELLPVEAFHSPSPQLLGEGESVRDGVYRFQSDYGWQGANYHRVLATNRCGFNSDRWTFAAGSEVVYLHPQVFPVSRKDKGNTPSRASSTQATSAKLTVNLNYYVQGSLRIEASRDLGVHWVPVATLGASQRGGTFTVPNQLFPATNMLVRLSSEGTVANFQINSYAYESLLNSSAGEVDPVEGKTCLVESQQQSADVEVHFSQSGHDSAPSGFRLDYEITNHRTSPLSLVGQVQAGTNRPIEFKRQGLQPAIKAQGHFPLPLASSGRYPVLITFSDPQGKVVYSGRLQFQVGLLEDPRPGYWLAKSPDALIWWCESGWKIGRECATPPPPQRSKVQPIQVSLARGEYEAVQVVLRPLKSGKLLGASLSPFRPSGASGAALTGELNAVAYVHVTQPTDVTGERGLYPDPLPPLRLPMELHERQNQPLWLTLRADDQARAGDYQGSVELVFADRRLSLPLRVHVYDFALPRETHLRSALGLDIHNLNRYHGLTRRDQRQVVYEKYLQNFAQHRISPYSFFDYSPIDIRFTGVGADQRAQVDFSRFDQAASKWLDSRKFNSFLLPLRGMGGGTFQSRYLGELQGFKEGTPEHARLFKEYLGQVEQHLREHGWLDQAYTYWFDEPDPKDYEFVVNGMKRIKAAAPGLKRLLTEQPEPALLGNVEIWCGLTPEWTVERVQGRRAAGEQVWWYICCAPKAPYVTEFIDHPGVELRLWPWQSWQYGVQGILIWATTYWTSPLVYPEPNVQDPWKDPMSYVSGYDFPVGHRGYWGNGDGRFLYPPRRDYGAATEPCLDEPVNSIRWENLRDGMEDYEYFWLLQQQIERCASSKKLAAVVEECRQLLRIPPTISKDLTHFTDDPRPLLEHRDRVARMIERLMKR
jgi:hypothetical protein